MTSALLTRPPSALRTIGWSGIALWTIAIVVLSSMTPAQIREVAPFRFWDKAAHFLAFAIGAANLALVLRWSTPWPHPWVALVAIVTIITFAATDEIHQLFTPGRSGGDVLDWLADTLGAGAGTGFILTLYARPTRAPLAAPARD